MSTNAADDPKPINAGEIITAAWLNSTRGPGTILGADGVQVSRAGNRLAVATTSTHKTPPVAAVPGTIASEDGSGEYTWTRVGSGEGPASGTATEATGATGIAVGTTITLHRTTGGVWWFHNVTGTFIGSRKHINTTQALGGAQADVLFQVSTFAQGMDNSVANKLKVQTAGWYRLQLQLFGDSVSNQSLRVRLYRVNSVTYDEFRVDFHPVVGSNDFWLNAWTTTLLSSGDTIWASAGGASGNIFSGSINAELLF